MRPCQLRSSLQFLQGRPALKQYRHHYRVRKPDFSAVKQPISKASYRRYQTVLMGAGEVKVLLRPLGLKEGKVGSHKID